MFQRPMRRIRDTPNINVVGQLSYLMLGKVISPNYRDPCSLVVDVQIDVIMVPNTLINLWA